jgi:hypothetical protein
MRGTRVWAAWFIVGALLLWLADGIAVFRGTSLCTICFSTEENHAAGLSPALPLIFPAIRPLVTWHRPSVIHPSYAAESLFASDHAHYWQAGGGVWARWLRSSVTVPVYALAWPASSFASRFNTQPEFRTFLARKVGAGELSTPELREVFRCSIYSVQERGLTTEKAGYRQRAEALVSDFLLAQPGRT